MSTVSSDSADLDDAACLSGVSLEGVAVAAAAAIENQIDALEGDDDEVDPDDIVVDAWTGDMEMMFMSSLALRREFEFDWNGS